jgi:hypothetical protein
MQFIRRTVLALTTTMFAVVAGTGTALAGPPPLPPSDPDFISPEAPPTSGGASSAGGFLDGWVQVTLAILVVAAVLAIAVIGVSRMRHHSPSTA